MRNRWLVALLIALFAGAALAQEAEDLVKGGDAETGSIWARGNVKIADGGEGGGKCFSTRTRGSWIGKQRIPVSPEKTYVLSASFKSTGKAKSRAYLGFVPFSAKGRQIGPQMVNVCLNTLTALAEDCKKTDKIIKIVDGAKWKTGRHFLIAFGAKKDFSDLPNSKLSSANFVKIEKKEGFWEVELKGPCGQAFPKGTQVRAQAFGGSYMYCLVAYKEIPDKWTRYTVKIKGMAKYGAPSNKFWPGTASVSLLALTNYGQTKGDMELLVDNISLVELDK